MSDNENRAQNPRVFVSYSWDSPEHRLWVESFAQELRKSGIDARLDAWRDERQSIDDFMMVEVVHWDSESLNSALRAMERLTSPYTVTDHFIPMLPELVPERPGKKGLKLLSLLVKDGRTELEDLSNWIGEGDEETSTLLSKLFDESDVKVKPVIQEDLIHPFPTFSIILTMVKGCSFDSCYSEVKRISRESWDSFPLTKPWGIWLKCFGRDLHAVDMMLERFRRMKDIEDVMVILPDSIVTKRSVDLNIVGK